MWKKRVSASQLLMADSDGKECQFKKLSYHHDDGA
jgi:hypothetical protein